MERYTLTSQQWDLIAPMLPSQDGQRGRPARDYRRTIEGILYIIRTGAPWRDLPARYGKWNTVHRTFRRWAASGVFDRIFEATSGDLDLRVVMVDGTFAKVHQHGTGAKKLAPARQISGGASHRQESRRADHKDHGNGGPYRETGKVHPKTRKRRREF